MIQLDILRGVAILLVLFAHADVKPAQAGSWKPVLSYLWYLGISGVDLFFVLSGFLVGGLLLKALHDIRRLDVRRFLIRRGFKIWPPYLFFIAFVFVRLTFMEGQSGGDSLHQLVPNLLHLQNYYGSPREHTWSLAVEEHFYLLLPLLLLALTTRRAGRMGFISRLPVFALIVCVASAIGRFFSYGHPHFYNPYYATHLRLDSLLFGVTLAYYYHFRPSTLTFAGRHRWKILGLSVALLLAYPALIIAHDRYFATFGHTLLYVAYGLIVLALVHTPVDSGWAGRVMVGPIGRVFAFIGVFSYPVYLWHRDVTWPMGPLLRLPLMTDLRPETLWLVAFLAYALMAIVGGVFFGLLVDRPSLALRERLFPAPTHVPTEQRLAGAADGSVVTTEAELAQSR